MSPRSFHVGPHGAFFYSPSRHLDESVSAPGCELAREITRPDIYHSLPNRRMRAPSDQRERKWFLFIFLFNRSQDNSRTGFTSPRAFMTLNSYHYRRHALSHKKKKKNLITKTPTHEKRVIFESGAINGETKNADELRSRSPRVLRVEGPWLSRYLYTATPVGPRVPEASELRSATANRPHPRTLAESAGKPSRAEGRSRGPETEREILSLIYPRAPLSRSPYTR